MTIDDIVAGTSYLMTDDLIRLFRYAGCDPTRCHACGRLIKTGMTFRLLAHGGRDEMVCDRCDEAALIRRDKRVAREPIRPQRYGGFSRPSKTVEQKIRDIS